MKNIHQPPPENSKTDLPGNPIYPASEDVYTQSKIEEEIDPEDVSKLKQDIKKNRNNSNELSFEDDVSGDDLDIPGSELDDDDEANGSEDEENNHYSLGGDNHDNLEEDNGD